MKKLQAIIRYECMTSFKYIWIFYGIQYAIVALITLIIGISMGSFENVGTNCLETNTLIYIGVLGVLGYSEDFKMLIQNGFTRKYIFIASISMFVFIAGSMALVDTVVGNVLHALQTNYQSVYGGIYGYENVFLNWLWLFLLYTLVCTLFYLVVLVINRIGKAGSLYLGIGIGGMVLLIIALFRFVFTSTFVNKVVEWLFKAFGFMPDGTINHLFPVLTLLILTAIFGIGAYAVIRRTELKK